MAPFLAELSGHVAPGAHAVLVLDCAGWHGAKDLCWPGNVTPLPPPASSPELNPQERVRAFLRQHDLALRRFLDHAAPLEACQDAWRRFIGQPGRVRSPCSYPWARRLVISRKTYVRPPDGSRTGQSEGVNSHCFGTPAFD